MDAIKPSWPKHRATFDLEPQTERHSHSHLRADIAARLLRLERDISLLNCDSDWPEVKAIDRQRQFWMEPFAVLELPVDVLLGARKRLLGDLPPVDADGEYLFSLQELNLVAAALWPNSAGRFDYLNDKSEAEYRAKRASEVNRVFDDLRSELH
nr:hypothetical protein 29 [bacterium]